jgi:hypothetical protein
VPDESLHGVDTPVSAGMNRRGFLISGAGLGAAGTLGVPTGTAGAFAKPTRDPVSMAMHIHSSFSEGVGSMDAHLAQARRLGVDVIWWTDHDFRKLAHGYRTSVGFDGPNEPAAHWNFDWQARSSGPLASGSHSFVDTPVNPSESGGKMQVVASAKSSSTWATHAMQAHSQNSVYSTSYSDTTVELDVYPQQLGSDARIVVEIMSSYRPASGGRPAGQYRIQYRLGDGAGRRTEDRGRLGVIGLAAPPVGDWYRLTIRPRNDHAELWPDTVADDASLWRINIGLMVRNGASARAVFDRLRFHRSRDGSTSANQLQLAAIDAYRSRYPNIGQFAASEISLVMHLNAFGGTGALPAYESPNAVKDNSLAAQRDMISFLRRQGATVCLNHPMVGAASARDLAVRLIRTNGMGAQLMEVGTVMRPGRLAGVFDAAARNGVLLTANGATDDHSGRDWLSGRRWITRVWSPTLQQGDLCRSLESGRAWFYDPLHWDGQLNIVVGGMHMGGVLFTRKRHVNVAVRATDLPRGAWVDLVIGKCDFAGPRAPRPVNRVRRLPRRRFASGVWHGQVDRHGGCYVRAAVRRANGDLIGFSNPVWVLPPHRRDDVHVPALRR